MKKWEIHLVVGIFGVIIGAILIVWAFQAVEPIIVNVYTHENIFGDEIFDNVEVSLDEFFLYPLIFGLVVVGMGLTEMGVVYEFYKLEKQIEEKKLEVTAKPKVEEKLFCRYCGKENKPDAVYCEGCGKKL